MFTKKMKEGIVAGIENMLTDRPPMARTGGRINIIFLDSTALIWILTTEVQIITDSQCRQYEYKMRKGEKGKNIEENGSC